MTTSSNTTATRSLFISVAWTALRKKKPSPTSVLQATTSATGIPSVLWANTSREATIATAKSGMLVTAYVCVLILTNVQTITLASFPSEEGSARIAHPMQSFYPPDINVAVARDLTQHQANRLPRKGVVP